MPERRRRTVRDLRRTNRSVLLRRLYFDGPLSRQDLARETGLSPASVSNVVSELIEAGLVVEAGSVESDGGRPRVLLKTAAGYGHLVGVDVGETRVMVELFDLELTQLAKADLPLGDGGHDERAVVRQILDGLPAVIEGASVDPASIIGVGVGVPGVIEHGPEAVVHCQTIGWDGVPLERMLRDGMGGRRPAPPLFVDNGATSLGQAEMWFGAGRGHRNAVVALIGSGVGAAVMIDGSPYRGAAGSAGEWGHTTSRVGGAPCRCGSRGCLESYVGATALLERYRAAGGPAGTDEEAALAGLLADPSDTAAALRDDIAEHLGAGIADLVNLFSPEKIIIGGWAGLLIGGRMLDRVVAATAAYALRQPFAQTAIELCHLGPEAVAVGAATLPLAHLLDGGGDPAGGAMARPGARGG
ncbi:ROK family transcriptional regulator [Actinomadura madurae]|uniref:Sugar kinase of the NBD/HSP70 family, may contain an N-terminal HTH domain n=2 Tax=Actinomadura madurae TaxID=1993 RepID=A0A1I5HIC3_9ACTN|nr:ROK family transcriptional regulator [Actinomadura madurae]SFO48032.1 Sugar kinase of the NBD/HSP70 family, may contain an N-terminal HTH domain [Actinomadura madurae]